MLTSEILREFPSDCYAHTRKGLGVARLQMFSYLKIQDISVFIIVIRVSVLQHGIIPQ